MTGSQDIFPWVKGGGRCTVQRYEALQGGGGGGGGRGGGEGGVKFSGRKRYVTLEWPLTATAIVTFTTVAIDIIIIPTLIEIIQGNA